MYFDYPVRSSKLYLARTLLLLCFHLLLTNQRVCVLSMCALAQFPCWPRWIIACCRVSVQNLDTFLERKLHRLDRSRCGSGQGALWTTG